MGHLATSVTRLRRAAGSVRRRLPRRVQRLEGCPAGIATETLEALCAERGRGRLDRCEHEQLSGWKARGTYRLVLHPATGPSWPVIFKDEGYSPAVIPALAGLPVTPGPPEAVIYALRSEALAPFLPGLLWFREVEPGRHFQYLLEDISPTHDRLRADDVGDHEVAARALVELHRRLQASLPPPHPEGLLRYDRRYSEGLLEYAARSLADHVAETSSAVVADLLDRWGDLVALQQRDEFVADELRVPIHGDYNLSNLHVRHRDGSLKVVDWEWAGIGLPHADLAALAKSIGPEHHRALVRAFTAADRRVDDEQHLRLFRWCRLERRLLDGAFLAMQRRCSARAVPWLEPEVARAAGDAIAVVADLR